MKVLVTFAVDAEFAPWRKLCGFRRIVFARYAIYEGQTGDSTVRVVLTGMGGENARRAMRAVLEDQPNVCISSGLAGGLKPEYRPGAVLAAREVGEVQGGRVVKSDPELLAVAADCGATTVDCFLASSCVVMTSEDKQRLGQSGDAVDMESFPVLAAAGGRGIPSVAIRAVADPVEEDLPLDFSRVVDQQGHVRYLRLIAQVAVRPHRLPGLIRLGRESRRAAEKLAGFLDRYIPALANLQAQREKEMAEEVAAT